MGAVGDFLENRKGNSLPCQDNFHADHHTLHRANYGSALGVLYGLPKVFQVAKTVSNPFFRDKTGNEAESFRLETIENDKTKQIPRVFSGFFVATFEDS